MRKLSFIIGLLIIVTNLLAQSPHGERLNIDCAVCHTTGSWNFINKNSTFHHTTQTQFVLEGQHQFTTCKQCHETLVFADADAECISCHTDMHNSTVGPDCARCHTTKIWMVDNITEIHQASRFPLLGAHNTSDCAECHKSVSLLEFEPLGINCIDCHRDNFLATTDPNHVNAGFSEDCFNCHNLYSHSWNSTGFNHNFFPLSQGHEINECEKCHGSNILEPLSNECYSCHQPDYLSASNPSHVNSDFSTSCDECHTLDLGWKPANFKIHDQLYFPIYSGKHSGEWDNCTECHTQPENLNTFLCTNCHEHTISKMNNEHDNVNGYSSDSYACFACHPQGNKDGGFNHNSTGFPLTGAHTTSSCLECHTSGYAGTSALCSSCHTNNYNQAANPNHTNAGINLTCEDCHTTNSWTPSGFNHTATGFELTGAHDGKQCAECHIGTTVGANPDCYSCHSQNYNETEGHLTQGFPHDCLECHNTTNWDDATFNHNVTNFPLTGAHIATECLSCHTNGYSGTPTLCNICHSNNYNQAANPNHTNAGITTTCDDCHTTTAWVPSLFNHTTTGFQLTGAHTGRQCADCHQGTTTGASPDCYSCHSENYTTAPEHVTQGFPHDCTQCHSTNTWDGASFDHNTTNFPLTGAHIATECLSCHTNGYTGTPTLCNSCHSNNYNQAANPNHTNAGITTTCQDCHTTTAWVPSLFNHTTTGFQLTGAHTGRQCADCHQGTTTGASPDCYSCHSENYTTAPGHVTQGFPHDCTQCHNTNTWDGAVFDHNTTNFPLTGAHIATECLSCHTNGYTGTPTLCNSCHSNNYNQAANPNHTNAGITTTCEDCHTTTAWVPSLFNHTTTGFQLTGAHTGRQCADCHQGTTTGASPDCYSCHSENYTTAPGHVTQGFPHDCTQCHSTNTWDGASFDHNTTNFPLTGAHIATECLSCHTNGYTGTPTLCNSCHSNNYNQAANPNHTNAGITTTCEDCHTTTAWVPSLFNHTTTGFQLTGAHTGRQCADCHQGTTTGASPDCYSCHSENYTTAPGHVTQGFPHDCTQCHSTNTWDGASFDHNTTNFPLTGAHIATECLSCHTNGYTGTATQCSACHQTNYNQTTNPNHTNLGFSTSCDLCHNTNPGWEPAQLVNHQDYYALNGAHAAIANDCYLCHAGNYTTTPNSCNGCHLTDYNNTTNPSHTAAQFPTNCESCHSENAWTPSTFNHDGQYFPIYSGKHQGEWNSCADCHKVPTNYSVFTCIDCHEHNSSDMANEHNDVSGYVYNSTNCFACHPTGRAED